MESLAATRMVEDLTDIMSRIEHLDDSFPGPATACLDMSEVV